MKKTFTKFLAALMLLAIFTPSFTAVGQTRENVTDNMTASNLAATGSSYTNFSGVSLTSAAVYAGNSAREYYNSQYNIQMRSNNSNSGIVTTKSGGTIVSITITVSHGTNTIDVYGKNTAYSAATDLYNNSTQGTKIGSLSATGTINVTDGYEYIGIRSKSGAIYLSSVDFVWNPGGTPTPIVETPTFSVEEGTYTEAQTVSINCATSGATIYYTTDGTDPTTSSNVYSSALTISETTTVKAMATKADMSNSAIATATYTINAPYSGPDYVRVTDITALTNGTTVIIAARYNSTATSYYAMTAATTGKPTGVNFTSTTSSNGEILPATIVNEESTYKWTVGVSDNEYTFTNASNQVLGYSSSTNFATGGNNTAWTMTRTTSGSSAMVGGYEGFYIVNKNQNVRGIALNNQHNYGPYSTGNNNSSDYNFYLDIFVKGYTPASVATPTFSLAEGTYYEAQNVTINCETQNADIYYTIDGSTPDANSTHYTGPISVTTTTTIKAIAYYGGANSNVATATYTIVPPLSTMDQIFAAATSAGNTAATVHIALDNWIVSGVNNSSHAFVTDGTKGFMIYASGSKSNHGFNAGDVLSGTVECKVQLYNGAAEITQLTSSTTGLTVTTGGTVTVSNTAMADLAGINTGALVSYQNLTCEERVEGNYTNYYLSDGTTEIQAYKTLLDNYADYLEDGKIYNITGVFVLNNSTKRVNPRSAADIEEVVVPHEEYTLTVSNLSHVDLFVFDAADPTTTIISGTGSAQVYDGTSVMISVDVEQGYVIESLYVDGVDVTNQIDAADTYTFTMPTHAVTVTASAEVLTGDQYELYSGALVEGDYIIYYNGYAMKNERVAANKKRLGYKEVTTSNNIIVTDDASLVWHIAPSQTNNYWTIYSSDAEQYAVSTGTKNEADMSATLDDKALWSVTVADESKTTNTYEFVNKFNYEANPQVNHLLRNNGTNGFACYAAATGGTLSLYKKVVRTYEYTITGYGNDQTVKNGWYLIASPVMESFEATSDNGFVTTNEAFDLYRFNPGAELAWENWKQSGDHYHFNIEHGRGYLYASQSNTTLQFTGTPNTDDAVTLLYDGWNLIGNPSNIESSITQSFYVMNDDHDEIVVAAGGRTVHGLEGIFVYGNQGDEIAFEEQPAKRANSQVTLNIVGSNGNVIDRAIVNLNEDGTLPKFMIDETNTKIYIPQNDGDYAIVSSDSQGTMPVNFKAKEIGQYTISVETEGIDLGYLHLIDRLTGDDVNLLLDSKYSFIASSSDMESRFILSFNENGINTNNATFAFQNGSDIIVNGEGELQIFDVMGRMVKSTVINGVETIAMPQGVYIFRLNENIQKIVVR